MIETQARFFQGMADLFLVGDTSAAIRRYLERLIAFVPGNPHWHNNIVLRYQELDKASPVLRT